MNEMCLAEVSIPWPRGNRNPDRRRRRRRRRRRIDSSAGHI